MEDEQRNRYVNTSQRPEGIDLYSQVYYFVSAVNADHWLSHSGFSQLVTAPGESVLIILVSINMIHEQFLVSPLPKWYTYNCMEGYEIKMVKLL